MKVTGELRDSYTSTQSNLKRGDHLGDRDAIVMLGPISQLIYDFFNVFLTVHLGIFILITNQLDAQNFCFTISLFHASTCFEHHVLIVRR